MSYEAALFGHLAGVLLFFGGVTAATIASTLARGAGSAGEVAALLRVGRAGALLAVAGTVLVLAFGLWLVELTRWSLTDGWLASALALFLASVVLGALGGRRSKRARLAAGGLPPQAEPPQTLVELLRDPAADALNWSAAGAALVVLALMVWKP